MAYLADALNRYQFTGETCEWCECPIILDTQTGDTDCECEEVK